MAYDATRERTVLFGGGGGDGTPSAYLGDTWLWDGVSWTRAAQGAAAPEARLGAALVYDEKGERAVLFGGLDTSLPTGNNYFPGTWEWNGSSWTSAAAAGPGGRLFHAMAYDAGRGRVVLFGGDRHHTTLGDTWEFDGGSGAWSLRATSGPAPRFAASMAYDRRRGVVVLFGGVVVPDAATGPIARNDTWEWDGAAWHERSLAGPLPSARYHAGLVWDAAREALVLIGGTNGSSDADPVVWELDAAGWHERESAGTGAALRRRDRVGFPARAARRLRRRPRHDHPRRRVGAAGARLGRPSRPGRSGGLRRGRVAFRDRDVAHEHEGAAVDVGSRTRRRSGRDPERCPNASRRGSSSSSRTSSSCCGRKAFRSPRERGRAGRHAVRGVRLRRGEGERRAHRARHVSDVEPAPAGPRGPRVHGRKAVRTPRLRRRRRSWSTASARTPPTRSNVAVYNTSTSAVTLRVTALWARETERAS